MKPAAAAVPRSPTPANGSIRAGLSGRAPTRISGFNGLTRCAARGAPGQLKFVLGSGTRTWGGCAQRSPCRQGVGKRSPAERAKALYRWRLNVQRLSRTERTYSGLGERLDRGERLACGAATASPETASAAGGSPWPLALVFALRCVGARRAAGSAANPASMALIKSPSEALQALHHSQTWTKSNRVSPVSTLDTHACVVFKRFANWTCVQPAASRAARNCAQTTRWWGRCMDLSIRSASMNAGPKAKWRRGVHEGFVPDDLVFRERCTVVFLHARLKRSVFLVLLAKPGVL